MSDIKLFRYGQGGAEALPGRTASLERHLHTLMEQHMECFLGVRFLAHEYETGTVHGGRIDSLGLDENNCPVIIEYKRHTNQNVINQGLYYLDWLLDHRAEFKLLVLERYGRELAGNIEWSNTRVLCIAGDFTKFDEHAVAQIGRNIELIRYKYFSDDLLMLEWVNPAGRPAAAPRIPAATLAAAVEAAVESAGDDNEHNAGNAASSALTAAMPAGQQQLYDELRDFIFSLGDDVNVRELQLYVAFTRLKNFACVRPMKGWFKVWLRLDPDSVTLEEDFSRDVRAVGHWGTGDLELSLRTLDDLDKARPLIERAYQES